MIKPFIRTAFNYDRDDASRKAAWQPGDEPSKTQQQFKEESDINTIVKRFGLTGQLPNGIGMPQSGDFTNVTDFQTAMNVIRDAEAAFLKVPGHIRARFGHDASQVIAFMEDPNNREEAIRLGFIEKPPEQTRPTTDDTK